MRTAALIRRMRWASSHGSGTVHVALFMLAICLMGGTSPCGSSNHMSTPPAREHRPNILFLLIDSLRSDHLGFSGYDRATSPCLDSLAHAGIGFSSAITQAPMTMASVPSLLSGRYPSSCVLDTVLLSERGADNPAVVLGRNILTLPSLLGSQGYHTAAFMTNIVVKKRILGLDAQFDHYDETVGCAFRDCAETLHEHALAWFDSLRVEPWFCLLFYMDVHLPYEPPASFARRFGANPDQGPRAYPDWLNQFHGSTRPSEADLHHVMGLYDGEIAYVDEQICLLLEELKDRGMAENLMIVVAADHGDEFMDHGRFTHGHSLYDELTRCPLIISWPEHISSQGIILRPVANIDIVPTILDLLNIDTPAGIQGVSLVSGPGGNRNQSAVFSEYRGVAVRSGRWKLWQRPSGECSLFDLAADPLERNDLATAYPDTVQVLNRAIEAWRNAQIPPTLPAPSGESIIDESTLDQLRILGYVE